MIEIVDSETTDADCKSIQSVLIHIVFSGHIYVVEIRKWLGEEIPYGDKVIYQDIEEYKEALREMFAFNEKLFTDYPNISLCQHDNNKKITVRWGQKFDVEQLYEHAIVHVLRHRRQIERFIEKMNS